MMGIADGRSGTDRRDAEGSGSVQLVHATKHAREGGVGLLRHQADGGPHGIRASSRRRNIRSVLTLVVVRWGLISACCSRERGRDPSEACRWESSRTRRVNRAAKSTLDLRNNLVSLYRSFPLLRGKLTVNLIGTRCLSRLRSSSSAWCGSPQKRSVVQPSSEE